jgi:hypothetical protein
MWAIAIEFLSHWTHFVGIQKRNQNAFKGDFAEDPLRITFKDVIADGLTGAHCTILTSLNHRKLIEPLINLNNTLMPHRE